MEDLFAFEKHCIILFFRCYNQKVFYLIPVHTCTLDNGSRQVLGCNSNFYFYYAVPCQFTQNYFLPLYLLKHCSGALLTFHENFNDDLYFQFLTLIEWNNSASSDKWIEYSCIKLAISSLPPCFWKRLKIPHFSLDPYAFLVLSLSTRLDLKSV